MEKSPPNLFQEKPADAVAKDSEESTPPEPTTGRSAPFQLQSYVYPYRIWCKRVAIIPDEGLQLPYPGSQAIHISNQLQLIDTLDLSST